MQEGAENEDADARQDLPKRGGQLTADAFAEDEALLLPVGVTLLEKGHRGGNL